MMYYPNKVEIEYEGYLVVSERFYDYLECDCYTIIDVERCGTDIAREIIEDKPISISVDDVKQYVKESLEDLKFNIENYVYEFIEDNYEGDFDREV